MQKTLSAVAVLVVVAATGASPARAQTAPPAQNASPSDSKFLLSVNGGGQLQTNSFGSSTTFSSYNETGRMESRQNVGRAFVIDVSGMYQLREHLGAGLGVWGANAKSAVAWTALLPDPVYFGRPVTLSDTKTDLSQSTLGVDLMLSWTMPISERLDLAISGGPTILRVRQDVGALAVSPGSQTATLSINSESKTTAKAGNVGIDLNYWINNRYGVGLTARYAGGSVDLPASNLKVGGTQIGAGFRMRPGAKLAEKPPSPPPGPRQAAAPPPQGGSTQAPGQSSQGFVPRQAQGTGAERFFLNINASSQPATHTLSAGQTFSAFNETGQWNSTQSIGRGFVFDVTGGYHLTEHLAVGAGVWTGSAKSQVAWSASMPDPLFYGRPASKSGLTGDDLKQSTLGVNFSVTYTMPVGDRMDVAFSLGPTLIHVSQDIGSLTVTPGSQSATLTTTSQTNTTGKAGNAGVDLAYRFTPRYGLGVFARYAGGEADLPGAPKLMVGGFQVGGGIRLKF